MHNYLRKATRKLRILKQANFSILNVHLSDNFFHYIIIAATKIQYHIFSLICRLWCT